MQLILGYHRLTTVEKQYLVFGTAFEKTFLGQGGARRTLAESERCAWKCLETLPRSELFKLPENYVVESLGYSALPREP